MTQAVDAANAEDAVQEAAIQVLSRQGCGTKNDKMNIIKAVHDQCLVLGMLLVKPGDQHLKKNWETLNQTTLTAKDSGVVLATHMLTICTRCSRTATPSRAPARAALLPRPGLRSSTRWTRRSRKRARGRILRTRSPRAEASPRSKRTLVMCWPEWASTQQPSNRMGVCVRAVTTRTQERR